MNRPDGEATAHEVIRLAWEADERSQRTGDPGDLGAAVAAWRSAVEAAGPGTVGAADRAEILSQAAGAVLRRHQATRAGTGDLDMAYRWLAEAVAATPEHVPEHLLYLSNAGVICQESYAAAGGPAMLDQAVSAFETAARLATPDDPDLPQYLSNLGNVLVDRFALGRDPDDLAQAVAAAGRAVDLIPSRSPDRALYLNNLANALLQRYEQSGAVADLDTAIVTLRAARRAARHPQPAWSDDRGMVRANLGAALRLRYQHRLHPRDLHAALSASREAVKYTRPESPELAPRLAGLADVMREQYQADGRIDRLESAIATYGEVLQHDAADPQGLMSYWNNLSNCLRDRYLATRNRQDLDRAVELSSRAVAHAGAGQAETAAMYLAGLGSGLRLRYLADGRDDDIRQALAAYRQAVAQTASGTPASGRWLSNLGNGLQDRYHRTGELADLSEAIDAYRQAAGATPADSAELSQIHGNLGTALADRYEISEAAADLNEAIASFRDGAARAGRTSAQRATHLDNLATALRQRHQTTGDLRSLDEALTAHRRALRLTPRVSADRAPRLSNYAASLMAHAMIRGSRWYAARGVRALRRAVSATRPQDTNWPRYAGNLANALRQRYERTRGGGDLREAIRLYRQTCDRGMETATAVAFYAARDWATWAASRRAWPEAATAYEAGVQAMERLLRVQIARHDQETWLRATQALPARAGYAYAHAGDPQEAALVIERFRAVLWSLTLADLDRMGRPDLAERYRRAAEGLAPIARN